MSGTYTLTCGCVALVEFERVVTLCPAHDEQWRELHTRAIAEHGNWNEPKQQEVSP